MGKRVIVALVIAGAAALSALPADAQVSVNVNIGPPPVIFAEPPRWSGPGLGLFRDRSGSLPGWRCTDSPGSSSPSEIAS